MTSSAPASARRWVWGAIVAATTAVATAGAQEQPGLSTVVGFSPLNIPCRLDSTGDTAVPRKASPGHELRSAFESAVARCQRAIQSGEEGVTEYVGLAEAGIGLWCFGFVPRDAILARADAAVEAALQLDDKVALAHTARGVLLLARRNWIAADQEFRRAVNLDPDQARAHQWYALFLAAMGRHDEAMAASRRAVARDSSPGTQTVRGATYYFARRFEPMVRHMEQIVRASPRFAPAHDWLGMAYV